MPRILVAMPGKCTGCGRCQAACSAAHEGFFAPSLARLGVENFPFIGRSVPSVCFHCANPDCLAACPEGAINHDETGTVLVHADRCTGCGACEDACPWGQIRLEKVGIAVKCDLCGGEPSCVAECYSGALIFAEPEKELRKIRGVQMKERSPSGDPAEKRRNLALRYVRQGDDS